MKKPLSACVGVLLLVRLASSALAQDRPAVPAVPIGSAENGKRLYMSKSCYFCHGTEGQGGGPYARIARVQRSADNFVRYVRRPVRMAAYSESVLSDAELMDIYAFLQSLAAPTPAKDIPLLRPARGAR